MQKSNNVSRVFVVAEICKVNHVRLYNIMLV